MHAVFSAPLRQRRAPGDEAGTHQAVEGRCIEGVDRVTDRREQFLDAAGEWGRCSARAVPASAGPVWRLRILCVIVWHDATVYTPYVADAMALSARNGFVERLRTMRRARGMTLTALSERSAIPVDTLQKYLAGTTGMPANALKAVAMALDVSADWLLFGRPWPLDVNRLAEALKAHDQLRQVSGDKLSPIDYAKVFASAHANWGGPDPASILKDELARRGIKLVEVPAAPPRDPPDEN